MIRDVRRQREKKIFKNNVDVGLEDRRIKNKSLNIHQSKYRNNLMIINLCLK
jgi:hypothetical protein